MLTSYLYLVLKFKNQWRYIRKKKSNAHIWLNCHIVCSVKLRNFDAGHSKFIAKLCKFSFPQSVLIILHRRLLMELLVSCHEMNDPGELIRYSGWLLTRQSGFDFRQGQVLFLLRSGHTDSGTHRASYRVFFPWR
jgi:hypothetical protein